MVSGPLLQRSQTPHTASFKHAVSSPPAPPWWRKLWVRVVVALIGFIGLTTAILFFSVDHFVKSRFTIVHDARQDRLIHLSQRTVSEQLAQMGSIARLLVNDVELVDSVRYDRPRKDEAAQAKAAVERIAAAFRLGSVSLWTPDGRSIAASGDGPQGPLAAFPNDGKNVHTAAIRRGDNIWLIAMVPLLDKERMLARLQLAKPLTTLFRPASGTGILVSIASRGPPPPGAIRVPAIAGGDPGVAIDIVLPDEVGLALADVKRVLALVMTAFGILLVAAIALLLRRLLHPVFQVIDATLAIGRGEFGHIVTGTSGSEMSPLVEAFNKMSDDLKRLRKLERDAQHREQLSAIGRVAARVAHDLNNPLTVISNVARLVAARQDTDSQLKDDMKLVLHHCDRSITTIQALLAYGRPIRPTPQAIDIVALCEEIMRRWKARYTDVSLSLSAPAMPVVALADPYRFEQMLDNLLDNARLFGSKIAVSTGSEDDMAFVSVTDNGPGFSAEAQAHLFEPFFTTRQSGTGLGLASCLAIARAHGGDLNVDGGPPARVTIWLPLASDESGQSAYRH